MRPILARAMLVWVILLQAPMVGAMTVHLTAAQAIAAGQDMVVICTADGIKSVPLSDLASDDLSGAVDCYCPCATVGVSQLQPEPGFDAHLVKYSEQSSHWLARSMSGVPPRSQINTRTGSPRSPPFRSV